MLNEVTLIGRLGKDPEIKQTANSNVVRLNVATWESYYNESKQEFEERTEWHSVECWSTKPDKYMKMQKGHIILVKGKLITKKFTDKEGVERYQTVINGKAVLLPGESKRFENSYL